MSQRNTTTDVRYSIASFLKGRLAEVMPREVIPVPVGVAPATLLELKRELRRAKLLLSAVPTLGGPTWSAARAWDRAQRCQHERQVRKLTKRIAAFRERHNVHPMPAWKPRPATASDRRIARQYDDVKATGELWPDAN